MELLIIRHGLPVRRELTEGAADPELAPQGREQAEHLARYLASELIDAVYASPLARARETAAPLAELLGMEIRISPGVAEWDQNSSEYVPVEELKAANDPRWQAMLAGELPYSHIAETLDFALIAVFFYPNYTSINRVAAASSGERSIVTINETSHLRGTGLPMGLFQQG